MPAAPPVYGYFVTNAFGNITFTNPLVITSPIGETNRLFVAEQRGRVAVITNLASPNRTTFLDIATKVLGGTPATEEGLLGLAFHPGYATNRYFYVYYTMTTNGLASGRHQRLARFEASPTDPNQALAGSEAPILTMFDQANNNNGGCIQFGPDGYLYLSLGDEGLQDGSLGNTQKITNDFWSGMIRIDVDNLPGNLPPNPHPAIHPGTYLVPADNPYVGTNSFNGQPVDPLRVRTEFWAVGFRNGWRFSFDSATGRLYLGDVGAAQREEINIVTKGGNYGWNFREGTIVRSNSVPGGFVHTNPILEYTHGSSTTQGRAVVGGVVYHGDRMPLDGYYIYGDYESSNVWALRFDGATVVNGPIHLARPQEIAGYGLDPSNGDVLMADQSSQTIKRLRYGIVSGGELPPTLHDTGAFTNTATLEPNPGVVPYDVNLPQWADNAFISRWFSVPNVSQRITWRAGTNYTFPVGTVWLQHFDLELTNGSPASRQRIETRVLVRDATGVYGVTYRWDSPTNAVLVQESGLDAQFVITEGENTRTQVWHYPARSECVKCHTTASQGGLALGFNSAQLNRDFTYGDITDNQLRALSFVGYFSTPATNLHTVRTLPALDDSRWSVEARVRAYLVANCSGCHQPGVTGVTNTFDTRLFTTLSNSRMIGGRLGNDGGNTNNRVLVPGIPERSMLLTRVASTGTNRMPPHSSTVVDSKFVNLLTQWITNDLITYESFSNWQVRLFGSTNAPNAGPLADPDADRALNLLEYLTSTSPTNSAEYWGIGIGRTDSDVQILFDRLANRGFEVQWKASLLTNAAWQVLNVPENAPLFAATNHFHSVVDPLTNGASRFYRVRAYEH